MPPPTQRCYRRALIFTAYVFFLVNLLSASVSGIVIEPRNTHCMLPCNLSLLCPWCPSTSLGPTRTFLPSIDTHRQLEAAIVAFRPSSVRLIRNKVGAAPFRRCLAPPTLPACLHPWLW